MTEHVIVAAQLNKSPVLASRRRLLRAVDETLIELEAELRLQSLRL